MNNRESIARQDQTRLWRAFRFIAFLIRPLLCRLYIDGAENVPPLGGCILACNHTHGPDFLFLGMGCPRQVNYMAKSELFTQNSLFANILLASGVFPVKRGQNDLIAVDQAIAIVQTGRILGMFPEGTRSRDGALMRGKTGAARIAIHGQVPIVPAVVINADKVFKRARPWQRPCVSVRFGKPISWQQGDDESTRVRQLTNEVMTAMAELLPLELRGFYMNPESDV